MTSTGRWGQTPALPTQPSRHFSTPPSAQTLTNHLLAPAMFRYTLMLAVHYSTSPSDILTNFILKRWYEGEHFSCHIYGARGCTHYLKNGHNDNKDKGSEILWLGWGGAGEACSPQGQKRQWRGLGIRTPHHHPTLSLSKQKDCLGTKQN